MGIFMMDSMRWPYGSFDCRSFIQEFGTDYFRLVFFFYLTLCLAYSFLLIEFVSAPYLYFKEEHLKQFLHDQ